MVFSCRAERVRKMTDQLRCRSEASSSTPAHFGTHKSLSAASSKCGVASRDGDAEAPCWLMDQVIWEPDTCWRSIPKRRRRPESRWDIDRAYEDGWAEHSGRWRGLSRRGQRLRLDHSGCGWSRILWAGCVYTLRCCVALDDTQRNVVMELFLHSCYGNRKDSIDLSDTRGRDCGSLRCFFVDVEGRIH